MQIHDSVIAPRFGLWAARAAVMTAPLTIFLALPPFYRGVWVQIDGAVPWLHALSALAALGCAAMAWSGDMQARAALIHPLVVIPAAIFVLALATLPAATVPMLSLLGTPEHGFGALTYLDLAALSAAAMVVCGDVRWRRGALAVAAATVAAAFALDYAFRAERSWAPFFFGDYLAFYAVFAFACAAMLTSNRALLVFAGAVCLGLIVLSANKAALLAVLGALALLPFVMRIRSQRSIMAVLVTFPLLVGLAIVLVGSGWDESYRVALLKATGFGPLPGLLIDSWASLWSRAMLVVVGAQSLIDSPLLLLTGLGWGHYNETLLANLPIVSGRFHELIGTSHAYWDAIRRNDFHSHNQYFEALLSGGFGAFALMAMYGAALFRSVPLARRGAILLILMVLTILQSFWFQMPHTLPVMALAVAFVARDERPSPKVPLRPPVLGAACLLAAVCLMGGWAVGWSIGTAAGETKDRIDAILKEGRALAFELPSFWGLDEFYRAQFLQQAYALTVAHKAETGAAPDGGLRILHEILGEIDADGGAASLKLAVSLANTRSGLAFALPEYEARYGSQDAAYGRAVDALLAKAPRRADLAIPYLNYLLARGREPEVLSLAGRMLARRSDDPVGLWFSGIVLLGNDRTADSGIRNLRRSLDMGIRNLMPVDAALVRSIVR